MPKEVTDPELLKELNAGGEAPGGALKPGETVSGTTAVSGSSLGDYAGDVLKFGKGFAQGGASTLGTIMDLSTGPEQNIDYSNVQLPPFIIPQRWRQGVHDFANEKSESGAQTAGRYAETATEFGLGGGLPGVAKGISAAARVGGWVAANEIAWETAKSIAGMTGTSHVWPIFLALKHGMGSFAGLFRHGVPKAGKAAEEAVVGGEKAAKAAPKAAPEATPLKEPPKEPPKVPGPKDEPKEPPQKRTTKLPGVFPWDQ